MLINRDKVGYHVPWVVVTAVVLAGSIAWYIAASRGAGALVGGGSLVGLVTGVIAGAIIAFEMLLWPRKWLRRLRLIPAKFWMVGHIWLGLLVLPMAILHSGFHLGGLLPTLLMTLLVLVYISGLYGLVLQQLLPRWMLRNVQAETITSQIDVVAEQTDNDLRRLLVSVCGSDAVGRSEEADDASAEADASRSPGAQSSGGGAATVVIGTVRKVGSISGRSLQTRTLRLDREDAAPLWTAYRQLRPYLLHGAAREKEFAEPRRVDALLGRLRGSVTADGQMIVDAIEQACDQRRQFDIQRRAQRWLHAWIPVHVILSVAVTILLAAHIYTALRYW